jgi:hypothetical protein
VFEQQRQQFIAEQNEKGRSPENAELCAETKGFCRALFFVPGRACWLYLSDGLATNAGKGSVGSGGGELGLEGVLPTG